MKIATSPGERIDCGRSKVLLEPLDEPLQSLAETLRDPAAVRVAADRLKKLVEKRTER